jgi:hypothetical protein
MYHEEVHPSKGLHMVAASYGKVDECWNTIKTGKKVMQKRPTFPKSHLNQPETKTIPTMEHMPPPAGLTVDTSFDGTNTMVETWSVQRKL